MNVRQVQELRRSNAATPIPGKRYIPATDDYEDDDDRHEGGEPLGESGPAQCDEDPLQGAAL